MSSTGPGVIIEQKKEDFVFVASAHDLGKLNEEPKGKILPVSTALITFSNDLPPFYLCACPLKRFSLCSLVP